MNEESIERLGEISTPTIFSTVQSSALGSTITVNALGDLLLLGQDGRVYFQNIRHANRSLENEDVSDASPLTLPIHGIDANELQRSFPHVQCNTEGSLLTLWSKTSVGIIEIPSAFTKDGLLTPPVAVPESTDDGDYCRFVSLLSPTAIDKPPSNIIKVDFHPLNPNCLVVLCEREIMYVIDLRTFEKEKIVLPRQFSFTSFSFAKSANEWFRFTIFLTTTQNEIYYLCPIIPNGTIISKFYVVELIVWTINHRDEMEQQLLHHGTTPSGREKMMDTQEHQHKYFQYCLQYLRSKFGKELIQQIMEQLEENPHYYDEMMDLQLPQASDQPSPSITSPHELTGRNMLDAYLIAENHALFVPSFSHQSSSIWNDWQDEKEKEDSEFSTIQIGLQGPLQIQRSTKQQELIKGVGVMIHDICTPTIPSQYQGMMAPIIVTVQSTGLVEVLLFDIMDESLWLLSPAWKSLSTTFDYLPVPNLVVADTFQVISSSLGELPSTLDYYELQADPVFSHYFYCINKRQGEVYLLISNWLESAMTAMVQMMDQLDQERRELNEDITTARPTGGMEEEKGMSSPRSLGGVGTTTIPNTTVGGSATATSSLSSSSSAHPVSECYPLYQNEHAPEEHRGINGLQIVKDPFVGHVLLLHSDLQEFVLVNITSHVKICQLQTQFQEEQLLSTTSNSKEINAFHEQLEGFTSQEHLRSRKSQQLLLQIAEGLQTVPKLEIFMTKDHKEIPKSEVQTKKELFETAQLLEKKVMTPLRSLLQNLHYHLELIEQLAVVQQELLEGKDPSTTTGTTMKSDLVLIQTFTQLSSSQQKELLLRQGIKGLLQLLQQINQDSLHKIASLQIKNSNLKERIDHYLFLLFKSRHPLTTGERLYQQQLQEWLQMIPKLTREIEIIKQFYVKTKMMPSPTKMVPSSTTSATAGKDKKKVGGGLFGGGLNKPSIGLPFQKMSTTHTVSKPSFFQQRGIPTLPVIGSPSATPTATSSASNVTKMDDSGKKEGAIKISSPPINVNSHTPSSATLQFTTTLGSSMFHSTNKALLGEKGNIFATSTLKPSTSTLSTQPMMETPVKSEGFRKDAKTTTDDSLLYSEMKNTMSLQELSDPSQTHVIGSTTTVPPMTSDSHRTHTGVQLQLSEQDQTLCLDLLKSQEELIQQNRMKVLALEKKLRLLRRLQQQQQQQSSSY